MSHVHLKQNLILPPIIFKVKRKKNQKTVDIQLLLIVTNTIQENNMHYQKKNLLHWLKKFSVDKKLTEVVI